MHISKSKCDPLNSTLHACSFCCDRHHEVLVIVFLHAVYLAVFKQAAVLTEYWWPETLEGTLTALRTIKNAHCHVIKHLLPTAGRLLRKQPGHASLPNLLIAGVGGAERCTSVLLPGHRKLSIAKNSELNFDCLQLNNIPISVLSATAVAMTVASSFQSCHHTQCPCSSNSPVWL